MRARIYRMQNGEAIPGVTLTAFTHINDFYYLADIHVYRDGLIGIPWLVDIEGFEKSLGSQVVTQVPDGATVWIYNLGTVNAADLKSLREEEFLKEVVDEIERLNDRPTSADKCRAAFERFLREQTEESREDLQHAYESVPEHNRAYLGDPDVKDIPIRMAIYGEQEIEHWTPRAIARARGDKELPEIYLPGKTRKSDT